MRAALWQLQAGAKKRPFQPNKETENRERPQIFLAKFPAIKERGT